MSEPSEAAVLAVCCSGDGWGPSCCCSLSNGSSSPGLLAASLSQPGLCPHPLQPDLHSLRPARSKNTKPELQRENEAPAQELPGCVQELAQGWLLTGQVKLWGTDKHHPHVSITNRSIQIGTSHRQFKLLHLRSTWGQLLVVGMALDWAVWHKWIANAQNKMPIMVLTLGARLFSPSCAHVSQAAADWGLYTPSLPPNL